MSETRINSSNALGPDGPFERRFESFRARPVQQALAGRIEAALNDGGMLVAESGTGTGKTFAYLVPAVLSGLKVIISTYTRNLQEQLFKRDLPAVCEVLGVSPRAALLKGRGNYICLHRLEIAGDAESFLHDRDRAALEKVRSWVQRHRRGRGDIAEISGVDESSPVWPLVTSTPENCLGGQCRFYQECYVNKARQGALAAEILVVNHHLFCADLGLKVDGFANLLPGADAVIFDEAHKLSGVASVFLGTTIGSGQILDLCRDLAREEENEQSQVQGLLTTAERVEREVNRVRGALPDEAVRLSWDDAQRQFNLAGMIGGLVEALGELADLLELAAPAGEGLNRCRERSLQLAGKLSDIADTGDHAQIRWAETTARSFRLHVTPRDVGRSLSQYLDPDEKTFIYTSATLSVNGRFDYFLDQVGAAGADTVSLPSPFDYRRQALLLVPGDLPDPRARGYIEKVVDIAGPIVTAARGRTFLLFTSHRALRRAAELLRARAGDWVFLVQGEAPRNELLERFRGTENAVLLGSASFWEGVDVQGAALSCVMIDKLPFEFPDEPVLQARFADMEEQGRRPFVDYQLPNAVIALRQGVGRLIRDATDKGVLVLFDPRLYSKSYGRVFLNSLPDIPVTRNPADAVAFLENIDS
ncbi:MAG: ATP-dependent DNA helicase [Gammaproteobacteria bacterium]|nr:ATP-dependent DNA helicase [Gammaproteobacteria bacterium]